MSGASWHARIDGGAGVGAGFLVSERHVLTCAHVALPGARPGPGGGARPTTVTFPNSPGSGAFSAAVVADGGWTGGTGAAGDLAVLALDRPAPCGPAAFAPLDAASGREPQRLLVHGFPAKYEHGSLAEYRAVFEQHIGQEWVQLEAWTGHGKPLTRGFSGAAAVLAGTGEVVGMVSAAANEPGVRIGRMLPAHVMARYWAPLGERIPTPGYSADEKARLRELVAAAAAAGVPCRPEQLYGDAAPRIAPAPPAQGFASLWHVAWFLLTEVRDEAAPRRFATRLADFVPDAAIRHALQGWPHRGGGAGPRLPGRTDALSAPGLPAAAGLAPPAHPPAGPAPAPPHPGHELAPPPGPSARRWAPILVEVEHTGAADKEFRVTVFAYDGAHPVPMGRREQLTKNQAREYALERIGEAYRPLVRGADELIVFALPRKLLTWPVHTWPRSKEDPSPLGSFSPVVVLDLARRRDASLQHKLHRSWEALAAKQGVVLHRVECGAAPDQVGLTVRLRRNAGPVGLTAPPRSARDKTLQAGLNAPAPVIIWPRPGCGGKHAEGEAGCCAGTAFLDALQAYLADRAPEELPYDIWQLRQELDDAGDSAEARPLGRDLALFWEDPRCLPDPTSALARSPLE